jgi:hypothetical protein
LDFGPLERIYESGNVLARLYISYVQREPIRKCECLGRLGDLVSRQWPKDLMIDAVGNYYNPLRSEPKYGADVVRGGVRYGDDGVRDLQKTSHARSPDVLLEGGANPADVSRGNPMHGGHNRNAVACLHECARIAREVEDAGTERMRTPWQFYPFEHRVPNRSLAAGLLNRSRSDDHMFDASISQSIVQTSSVRGVSTNVACE